MLVKNSHPARIIDKESLMFNKPNKEQLVEYYQMVPAGISYLVN